MMIALLLIYNGVNEADWTRRVHSVDCTVQPLFFLVQYLTHVKTISIHPINHHFREHPATEG